MLYYTLLEEIASFLKNLINKYIMNKNNNNNNNKINITPIITYINADKNKSIILTENKRKSGIYR